MKKRSYAKLNITLIHNLKKKGEELGESEETLKQKNRELDSFINNIPDMAWLKDINSNFIAANKAFGDAVGMDPKFLVNHTCEICFGKKGAKKFKEDDKRVMKSRKQIVIEESIKDAKGNKVWLETIKSPILNESGKVVGTVGVARNITERKKAEEEKEKLLKALETAAEAINITDSNARMIYTNEAMDKLFGYKKGELIGKHVSILNAGSQQKAREIPKIVINTIKKKGVWTDEIQNKKRNGTEFTSLANITALIDKDGKITNYISVQQDITEKKKAEWELKKRYKELGAIYSLSKLVEKPGITIKGKCRGLVDLIPPAWQYPEITCARILKKENGFEYKTKNFKKTKYKQSAKIGNFGILEVYYLEKKPFLKEERALINALAERLKRIIERMKAEEKILQQKQKYEKELKKCKKEIKKLKKNKQCHF